MQKAQIIDLDGAVCLLTVVDGMAVLSSVTSASLTVKAFKKVVIISANSPQEDPEVDDSEDQ